MAAQATRFGEMKSIPQQRLGQRQNLPLLVEQSCRFQSRYHPYLPFPLKAMYLQALCPAAIHFRLEAMLLRWLHQEQLLPQ
jgi:hypothetical protein